MKNKQRTRCRSILFGILDTGGYFGSLALGMREIGCRAELLHLGAAKSLNWSPDDLSFFPRLYYRAYQSFHATRERPRYSLLRLACTFRLLLAQTVLIAWIAATVDAIVLKSGESLLVGHRDLALLRKLGKRIVFIYQGSDSRPPYLVGSDTADLDVSALHHRTDETFGRLKKAEPWADVVIVNPLSAHFHSGRVCIGQVIGPTVDRKKVEPGLAFLAARGDQSDPAQERPIRILHAPSDPVLKGSDVIRSTIQALRANGHGIEYVEITGQPNSVVMMEIAKCDIVIDDLYSDSHAGLLGVEACAFGRSVVSAGYGAAELNRLIPQSSVIPTEFCHPDELFATLERLITDPGHRAAVGARAMEYFEQCAPAAAARRLLSVIEGTAPEDWFVDARDICYVDGVAGPARNSRARVRALVERYGSGALRLDDKPELRDLILESALSETETVPTQACSAG